MRRSLRSPAHLPLVCRRTGREVTAFVMASTPNPEVPGEVLHTCVVEGAVTVVRVRSSGVTTHRRYAHAVKRLAGVWAA